jgi:cytoskeleton protein RodZ
LEGVPDFEARQADGGVPVTPLPPIPPITPITPISPATPGGPAATPPATGPGGAKRTLLRPPPWDKSAELDAGTSFGTWLRRQREARQISLREIAERTKISFRYLEAMEEDRFETLPAPVFAKGFLREYARYVGLSPDEVVNHYLSVQQAQAVEESAGDDRRERRGGQGAHSAAASGPAAYRGGSGGTYGVSTLAGRSHAGGGNMPYLRAQSNWPRVLAVLAGVVVLLGLVALLAFFSERWRQARTGRGEDRPPSVAPVAAPAPPPPPVPAAAPSAPLEVTVEFNQECWVAAVVDGGSRRAEMREQGESMQLEAKQSVVFSTLGNAGAVEIQVNGYPFPLEKKPGEVVHDLKIDLDTVRALKAKKEGH